MAKNLEAFEALSTAPVTPKQKKLADDFLSRFETTTEALAALVEAAKSLIDTSDLPEGVQSEWQPVIAALVECRAKVLEVEADLV